MVIESEVQRSSLNLRLAVPTTFTGDEVHCWLAFISADGKQLATSVYLGKILV